LAKTLSVSELVRELKRESSKWLKEQSPGLLSFYWQNGYGAFSISPGHVEALTTYTADQEEHHKKESFQDEFRRLLQLCGIEFDEKYVWD
jgi:putative transposase